VEEKQGPAWTAALNRRLEQLMPVLTPLGVALGFILPRFFIVFRPFIPWIFAVMTLSGALKLKIRELGLALRHPLPIILALVSSHVIIPLVVFFLSGLVFPGDGDTVSGFVLLYAAPAAVSSFMWVTMYQGDKALALAMILVATAVSPVVVPFTLSVLMGARVVLDMRSMALALVLMVVVPTIAGVGANELSRGRAPRLLLPSLNPLAKFCLILVIAANAAAIVPHIRIDDRRLWIVAALGVFFAVMGHCVSWFAGLICRLDREKQVTVFFCSALRNISAAATLAIEFLPQSAALPALLGIVFQQTLAALMGRFFLGPGPDSRVDFHNPDHLS
jgi:predicted Na+-dependent transporter